MIKYISIHLTIDVEKHVEFDALLDKYKLNFFSQRREPRRLSEIWQIRDVKPCHYYSESSSDFSGIWYPDESNSWDKIYFDFNSYIQNYLKDFTNLEFIKNYFLPESKLLIMYESYIEHLDIKDFSSETIAALQTVGLGIGFNHK